MIITLKDGDVTIALRPDLAPKHVAQIKKLVRQGAYDNVAFHRVIDGFMAQTGDVKFGNMKKGSAPRPSAPAAPICPTCRPNSRRPSTTSGAWSAWPARRTPTPPITQFFIMFAPAPPLDGQ